MIYKIYKIGVEGAPPFFARGMSVNNLFWMRRKAAKDLVNLVNRVYPSLVAAEGHARFLGKNFSFIHEKRERKEKNSTRNRFAGNEFHETLEVL